MINSANSNEGIMLNGIDPDQEKKVTRIYKYVKEGTYFPENKKNGILVGEKLAKKLKIKIHSKVVITLQLISGDITNAAFRVTGIYKTDNSTFDGRNAYVRRSELASVIGVNSQTAHEIAIAVYDDHNSASIASSYKRIINTRQLSIELWNEVMPELGLLAGTMNYVLYIFMVIIFLALSFGIINTMLMAVIERVREIGMLMAIGMNKTRIFMMIMLETILLMLTGSFTGLVLAWFMVHYLGKVGIDLSKFASGMSGFGFSSKVYPALETMGYIKIVIMVVIAGILSSIVPAREALQLNPSEAIRKL